MSNPQESAQSARNSILATQKLLQDNKVEASGESFEKWRDKFKQMGIKWSYDPNESNRRVIMSHYNHNMEIKSNIAKECNGLILEAGTWEIICMPMFAVNHVFNTQICDENLKNQLYKIYKSEDGTVFSMYYYKVTNQWIIATSRGYSMNNVTWFDLNITYEAAIKQALAAHSISWEEFINCLDKDKSYTFGFKIAEFHPFCEGTLTPINKIWFIQSVSIDKSSAEYLQPDENSPHEKIPTQTLVSNSIAESHSDIKLQAQFNSMHELYKAAKNAYTDFLNDGVVCYGFILKSVNPGKTGVYSNLYIESSLMAHIRNIWYSHDLLNFCKKNYLNKTHYTILKCYLQNNLYQIFRCLFPQFNEAFNDIGTTINDAVNIYTGANPKLNLRANFLQKALKTQLDAIPYNKSIMSLEEYKRALRIFLADFKHVLYLYNVLYAEEDQIEFLLSIMQK